MLSGFGPVIKNVGLGAAASIAAQFAGNINRQFGPGAALAGVGYFGKSETLQVLGGMSLGASLAGTISGGASGNTGGGWY
jgi:hypothetical protein